MIPAYPQATLQLYWNKATTESQQAQLGLVTPPNNQVMNLRQYNQLMYTHTFPNT